MKKNQKRTYSTPTMLVIECGCELLNMQVNSWQNGDTSRMTSIDEEDVE